MSRVIEESIFKRWEWEHKVLFVIFVISMLLLFVPRIHSDGRGYYAYIRSLAIDHDLDFTNEFTIYTDDPRGLTDVNEKTITGYVQNVWSVGPAILWIPFFYAAHLGSYLLNFAGVRIPIDGYSLLYVLFASLGSVFYAFIGILLTYDLCTSYFSFSKRASLLAVIFIWFASALPMYMYREPTMGHTFAFFSVSLFLYIFFFTATDRTLAKWVLLGVSAGIMTLVRWQDIGFVVIPIIFSIRDAFQHFKSKNYKALWMLILCWGIFLAIISVLFLPQALVWKTIYGTYLLNPHKYVIPEGGDRFMLWTSPNILGLLFSMRHGLFTWAPILLLAVPGFYLLYRKSRVTTLALFLALAVQIYINASAIDWWSSISFGQRRMIETLPIFIFALAAILDKLKSKAAQVSMAVGTFFIAWNLLFLIQYCRLLIPPDIAITFNQMFVEKFRIPIKEIFMFFAAKYVKDLLQLYGISSARFYLLAGTRILGLVLVSAIIAFLAQTVFLKIRKHVSVSK